jgi:hypothetical protein
MTRHFFISADLDDLERLEEDLEGAGVVTPQIHLLTLDDSGAENHHHLHKVTSLMKKDVIHSTIVGAAIGLCMSILVLVIVYAVGWTETPAGWLPFIFLAIIVLGFCTWEGGLFGIETPNLHFKRFSEALKGGKHVFFVDLEPKQGKILKDVVKKHSTVEAAGTGHAAPHWIVFWQHRLKHFFVDTFP